MARNNEDEVYDEDEDIGDSVSVVAACSGRRRHAGSARGSDGGGDDSHVCNCWLCGGPGPVTKTWLGRVLDLPCWNAIRCHNRLLPDAAAKAADRLRMLHYTEEWKTSVLPLRRSYDGGGFTRAEARAVAKGAIIKSIGYNDQAEIADDILLPKRAFCSYMRLWEGYNTESASESFDGRLGKSESDHEDEGGRKCVRVKDYQRLRKQSGRRGETTASRGGDANGGGAVTRDRGAERPARRGRSRERQRRGRHEDRDRRTQPERSRSPAPSSRVAPSSTLRGSCSRAKRRAPTHRECTPIIVEKGVSCSWRR